MSDIREKTIEGLRVGDTFTASRTFLEQDIIDFADMTRDYNPVHFDDRFIRAKKLRGRICHGLLIGSLVTEIGGQIGFYASKLDFRFKKPVYSGETITCTLTISARNERNLAEAKAVCRNTGREIVLEAFLQGYVPNQQEREILKSIMEDAK